MYFYDSFLRGHNPGFEEQNELWKFKSAALFTYLTQKQSYVSAGGKYLREETDGCVISAHLFLIFFY